MLLWVAAHALLLAVIAAVWGLAVVTKAVLGFLVHAAFWIILALTGLWLALRLGLVRQPVASSRIEV